MIDPGLPTARVPVYLVAAEGGGLRNAYWTALVLSTLAQDPTLQFAPRLFAVSGASGGSVGAAVYAAGVREFGVGSIRGRSAETLRTDLLSPVMTWALSVDLVQQFLPIEMRWASRARPLAATLEAAWPARTVGVLAQGFQSLHRPAADGRRTHVPHLILNTTDVATGERVVISHLWLGPGVGSLHGYLGDQYDVTLSTAAFISARFPFVTPAASIPLNSGGKLRLADGGYFENSGCASLLDVLRELLEGARPWWWDHVQLRVIVIDYADTVGEPHEGPHRFGDAMSPLRAMLATREARGRQAMSDLAQYLESGAARGLPIHPDIFLFQAVDGEAHLPLGWYLSPAARRTMERQMPGGDMTGASKAERDSLAKHMEVIEKMRERPR